MENITIALFLSIVAKSVVDAVAEPLRQKFPKLDLWWLIYVAWVVGGVLSFLAKVDLFVGTFSDPVIGQVLTAVLVGGGAKLINDLFKKNAPNIAG